MRDKEFDFLLVLAALAEGESLNKYQIEQRAKIMRRRAEDRFRRPFPQSVNHRAIRDAIECLEERGEIHPTGPAGPGRAPHTKTIYYGLTELGQATLTALKTEPEERSPGYIINVSRARQITEERDRTKWAPAAERAYLEMLIVYNWLIKRLGDLLPAVLAHAKNRHEAEKHAQTVTDILVPDLAAFIRVCHRYRDTKTGNVPVLDYVTSSDVGEESMGESCRIWVKKFAPNSFHEFDGKIPDEEIALISVLSNTEKQAERGLTRAMQRLKVTASIAPTKHAALG